MEFKQRIILLHNGVCCLVSKQPDSSNLFLILSPSGAYARIYFQGNQYQHLTRFVPVRFEESIKQLLKFRNTFSDQPFLCKRFHSTGTETSDMSPNVFSTQCVEYHSWKLHVCPLLRRISLFKDYCINTDDNCIEYPIRGVDLARSHMIKCERVYPLCRIPSTVRQAILSSTTSKTNIKEIKCIMQSAEAVAGSSHSVVAIDSLAETSHFLDALMIHMSILASDRDAYPVGISATNEEKLHMLGELETLVVAECLDEDVYLVSNGPAEGSGNVDVRQLKKALRRIQSSGSSAISNKMEENKPNLEEESLEESAVKSTELEVEVWIHPSDAHPAEVIIHLKGDYFTFHSQSSSGGELFEKTIHYSFLQYELHRRAQVLELGPDDLSWASTSAPDNENDDYASFSAVMLLHRYYKQALKLIRYRDYLLENSQRCGEAAFNRALLTQDKLHESTADRRLPYQQDKQLNKYSQASGSCSTVSITSEDGSTFSAVLKYCADAAEAAPFSLVLSQVPSSQYATVPPVKSSPRGRVFPCDCVTQISATFADHTMLKFDLVSQMFSLLFSTGRECSFSLGSYKREEGIFACQAYIPQIDDTFHGSANPPSIAVHGINVRYPTAGEVNVPHICHLVRRVLAFHRWADTPAALRPALEEHDRRTAVVARAAALQASRHLLMTRVAKGNLSAQEALSRSSMFVSRMQSLTNPSSPTLGSHQIRANNVAVSPTSHSREASTISSTSPTPFSCITPSPVGRRVAVVSEGSTIATGTSERSSSLTYSQISSIPTVSSSSASFEAAATSSNRHANAATPGRRVAIVSPESAYSEEDNVTLAADQVAGCYLYKNISIHPTLNSFGKLEPHIVSPDSKFEEVMSSNKKTCAKVHLVEIPHSRKLFPDYQPALNATTTKYLSSTYVQSAVDDSMRQASKNAEYLKQFSMPAVE